MIIPWLCQSIKVLYSHTTLGTEKQGWWWRQDKVQMSSFKNTDTGFCNQMQKRKGLTNVGFMTLRHTREARLSVLHPYLYWLYLVSAGAVHATLLKEMPDFPVKKTGIKCVTEASLHRSCLWVKAMTAIVPFSCYRAQAFLRNSNQLLASMAVCGTQKQLLGDSYNSAKGILHLKKPNNGKPPWLR